MKFPRIETELLPKSHFFCI